MVLNFLLTLQFITKLKFMFNIGDRVKCINTGKLTTTLFQLPNLVMNREYIVYSTKICSCGAQKVDVGLIVSKPMNIHCECKKFFESNNIRWCSSKRFVKVQESKEYIAVASNVEIEELTLN